MPNMLYTTQNLIDEVRSQIDEANADSITDGEDILPSLNRAQDYAMDIIARKYPDAILAYQTLVLASNVAEYDIPDNVFEDRVERIEISIPSGQLANGQTQREVQRVSYRDVSNYESASKTNVPYYYCIISRKIRFVPSPTGTFNARLWYIKRPEKLVLPQGRITVINNTSNYVIVDSVGDSLTTQADALGSYVNLVDGQTGEIKGTLQIQNLNDNKVTFRSSPTRTSIVNRTVTGDLSSITNLTLDDYISPIDGTCVPYFAKPTGNFMIQYTVSEMTRKLGGDAQTEEKILDKFEKQVEKTWVMRETQLRIKKRSNNWGVPTRRWYFE